MKISAYSPSVDNPTLWITPTNFNTKILILPSMVFQKPQPPINKGGRGEGYTMNTKIKRALNSS